jgi:7-cyano-7-deazaguanine reductase
VAHGKTAKIEKAHTSWPQRSYCSKRSVRGYPRDLRQPFATSLLDSVSIGGLHFALSTGQADFAEIQIDYQPGARCLETKSLKFYLASYRNERAFNEAVTNRILDDLVQACDPRRMIVQAEFAARGGISLTITATYPEEASGAAR